MTAEQFSFNGVLAISLNFSLFPIKLLESRKMEIDAFWVSIEAQWSIYCSEIDSLWTTGITRGDKREVGLISNRGSITGISLVVVSCGGLRKQEGNGERTLEYYHDRRFRSGGQSLAFTISFSSATSGEISEVEVLELTFATTGLLRELELCFALEVLGKHEDFVQKVATCGSELMNLIILRSGMVECIALLQLRKSMIVDIMPEEDVNLEHEGLSLSCPKIAVLNEVKATVLKLKLSAVGFQANAAFLITLGGCFKQLRHSSIIGHRELWEDQDFQ
ncbi:hypothetical protein Tco_1458602 [Tanacetum coccineum]